MKSQVFLIHLVIATLLAPSNLLVNAEYKWDAEAGEWVLVEDVSTQYSSSQLPKGTGGRKGKCTQLFPVQFFHTLSHGTYNPFFWNINFQNLEMDVSDWLLKHLNQ